MMRGSDYPLVSGREGYGNSLRGPIAQLAAKSEADRGEIFGGTALEELSNALTYLLVRTLVLTSSPSRPGCSE